VWDSRRGIVLGIFRFKGYDAGGQFLFQEEIRAVRRIAARLLSGDTDGEQVLVTVIRTVQVIATFGVPEVELHAAGPQHIGTTLGQALYVERAEGDLGDAELTPVHDAVVATRGFERIAVLNTIRVDAPMIRIVRTVHIRTIGRRQEAARPNVDLIGQPELRDRIDDLNFLVATGVFGIEHQADLVGGLAAQVNTSAVEIEVIDILADAFHLAVSKTSAETRADRNRRQGRVG